ncbi:MAG: hypothetical protein OD918_05990, partial [Gammaproteobacteria bacterium]
RGSRGGQSRRGGGGGGGGGNQAERAEKSGRGQPRQSNGRPKGDAVARPTRRDFAAHQPEQRVGHRNKAADPAEKE